MWSIDLERFLWAAGLFGHAVLLFLLIHRHHVRRFPVFTVLVGYNVLQSVFVFWCLSHLGTPRQQYFYFWLALAVGYVLEIAFIVEIAMAVMRASGLLVKQALRHFLFWAALGSVFVALVTHGLTARKVTGWDLWDMRATYFATCVTGVLYLAMLRAVNLWQLPWRSHVMILGQGFTIWQFASTLMDSAHIWRGWRWADKGFDQVSGLVYLLVLSYWIWGLSFPEKEMYQKIAPESERVLAALSKKTVGSSQPASSRR